MTTANAVASASPAPATTTTRVGSPDARDAPAGPFTALLEAALGEATPETVAEVLEGLRHAVAPEGEGDGEAAAWTGAGTEAVDRGSDGEELLPQAVAEVVAAMLGSTQALRPPNVSRNGTADGGAGEQARPAGSSMEQASTGTTVVPAPAPVEGEAEAVAGERVVDARPAVVASGEPAAPSPTAGTVPRLARASDEAAAILQAVRSGAVALARAPASMKVEATAPTDGAAMPPPATTSAPAAAPAAPAPTPGAVAGMPARLISLVIEAAEALENAPPPRRMTVEVPGSDGLRLQVALRGTEVHVNVQAATGSPDLGAWGRELASSLASRGMSLGGFQTGTDGQFERRHDQPEPEYPVPEDDQPTPPHRGGRTDRDDDLRL